MIRFLITVITRNEWSRWVNLADDSTISLAHFNPQDPRDVKAQPLCFIYLLFVGSLFSLLNSVFRKFLIVWKLRRFVFSILYRTPWKMYEISIYCIFNPNFGKEFSYKLKIQKRFRNPLFIFNVPQQNDSMWRLPKSFHTETNFVSAYLPKTQNRANIPSAEFCLWPLQPKSLFFE